MACAVGTAFCFQRPLELARSTASATMRLRQTRAENVQIVGEQRVLRPTRADVRRECWDCVWVVCQVQHEILADGVLLA